MWSTFWNFSKNPQIFDKLWEKRPSAPLKFWSLKQICKEKKHFKVEKQKTVKVAEKHFDRLEIALFNLMVIFHHKKREWQEKREERGEGERKRTEKGWKTEEKVEKQLFKEMYLLYMTE